jgi:hypothetical protein
MFGQLLPNKNKITTVLHSAIHNEFGDARIRHINKAIASVDDKDGTSHIYRRGGK